MFVWTCVCVCVCESVCVWECVCVRLIDKSDMAEESRKDHNERHAWKRLKHATLQGDSNVTFFYDKKLDRLQTKMNKFFLIIV